MMRPYWPHENDPSILDGSLDTARNADELMSGIVARRLVEQAPGAVRLFRRRPRPSAFSQGTAHYLRVSVIELADLA
jgi:hypothetical protein